MGAHPWWYFVPYDPDIGRTLQALRALEFAAGRYNPVVPFPSFPLGSAAPGPGTRHKSTAAAMKAADADDTRSILNMKRVGGAPDYGVVAPTISSPTSLPPWW